MSISNELYFPRSISISSNKLFSEACLHAILFESQYISFPTTISSQSIIKINCIGRNTAGAERAKDNRLDKRGSRISRADLFTFAISYWESNLVWIFPSNCNNYLSLNSRFYLDINGTLLWTTFKLFSEDCDNRVILSDSHYITIPSITKTIW